MIDLGTKQLTTERLVLRKFKKEDSKKMFINWASDSEVAESAGFPCHKDEEITKEVIEIWLKEYDNEHSYNWVVELKENSEIVGNISVVNLDKRNEVAEIGYCYGKKWWNKGIATECLIEVIRFLLQDVGIQCIEVSHRKSNFASQKVIQKVGFQYEGTLRSRKVYNHIREDVLVYSIVKK